jgi:DNA repair protein RecN (Recombination protein N)
MLRSLLIRNFAIVDKLELEFSDGFTAITGETGAGKSILVDALGLLMGRRADTAAIRADSSKAELCAEFELEPDSPALEWLRDADLDQQPADVCLIRRMISASGRSRAWINGTPVTLQQLEALGGKLVEIHGQNEHIRLVHADEQFRLLDGTAVYARELDQVRSDFDHWHSLQRERESLLSESPLTEGDLDLLQYQIREIEGQLMSAEAFAELEREHRRLAQGKQIAASLEYARDSLEADHSGIIDSINAALSQLRDHGDLVADIAESVSMLQEASINCEEAHSAIVGAQSRLDLSPERLAEVERTLGALHELARKHRCEPEQLETVLDTLRERFERSGSLDNRLKDVEQLLAGAESSYRLSAADLYAARKLRARSLADSVTALLQELGMKGGVFEIELEHLEHCTPSARGSDRLVLQVSANPGIPPAPLRKVASGGELSRISLAIKVASKSEHTVTTQIFDEVDAGIGGDTAHAVGQLIRSLSSGGQSLCVTHLAQVAVCAHQQYQVNKSAENELTSVSTSLLDQEARVDEIARMLGGRLSDQSRAHAAELLSTASTRH